MSLPVMNFKWQEIMPFADLDAIEGVDGWNKNICTYDQLLANSALLAMSRFKWKSKEVAPYRQLSETIEFLLFTKGQCALFKDGETWKVRLCEPTGGIDEFGQPASFTLTDFTGGNTVVVKNDDERFIWIKNNASCIPTIFWIIKYCNRVTELERTMDLNIEAQKTPYLIETTPEIHLSIQNIFKQIKNMDEVVYVDQKTGIKDNVHVLNLEVPYLVDKLYTQKTNEFNDLLNFLGIQTVKEKTAHLLYKEATATGELVDSYLDMFSASRIEAVEIAKERGLDLKLSALTSNDGEKDKINEEINTNNNGKNLVEEHLSNEELD